MSKISVIVPIYNVDKYLYKCLESIIQQSFWDLEIILVNDGSTDGSEEICKTFLEKDNRIKYYYKKNGGLSSARNYGLSKSTCDYIYFVDSDDYIEPHTCEILYKLAVKFDADLVVGGYNTIDVTSKTNTTYIPTMAQEFYLLSNYEARKRFVDRLMQEKILIEVIWNKLYKRSIFDKILFPYRRFEDSFMCYSIYDSVNRVCFTEECIYNYLVNRKGSITSSCTNGDIERWDSLFMKAFLFYNAYPSLKSTNKYFYMCLKNILRNTHYTDDSDCISKILIKEIKSLSCRKIGLFNKAKIIYRYR